MLFSSVTDGFNCRISGLEISHLVDIFAFACGQSAILQARLLLKETLLFFNKPSWYFQLQNSIQFNKCVWNAHLVVAVILLHVLSH